ncbi:hypothetical protein BX265_5156 [Streptomyces sp. TLI_235]|nr:hypothetical protein [Streptomyces sp. TLI_235]PBC70610.1 hypothetical protein BX265_5156 [Streptomyces sp. TLI_235]
MTHADRDLAALGEIVEPVDLVEDETVHRVRTVVANHAHDRADFRLLLEALGLATDDPRTATRLGPGPITRSDVPGDTG